MLAVAMAHGEDHGFPNRADPSIADAREQIESRPVDASKAKNLLITRTLAIFQPRSTRALNQDDARQIAENMCGFFQTLNEWAWASGIRPAVPRPKERMGIDLAQTNTSA